MGTSMGGMHTWLWGEMHPDFMDALMPLASLPTQISGRNRVWRRVIIDSIRDSPDWQDGDYHAQPAGLRIAAEMLYFMGSNPVLRMEGIAHARSKAMRHLNRYVTYADDEPRRQQRDVCVRGVARIMIPGRTWKKFSAPLLAINSADDLINPPELARPRTRDQAGETRPGHRDSLQWPNGGTRQPHQSRAVEKISGAPAEGDGKEVNSNP